MSPTRGGILLTPTTPLIFSEQPGPSHVLSSSDTTLSSREPSPEPEREASPEPKTPVKTPLPVRLGKKKNNPAKQKRTNNQSTLALKRLLYLKRIRLTEMEINYKKRLYELDLKIKQAELKKISNK